MPVPTVERCPGWPPPSGEPIGIETAREILEWVKQVAPPLIANAGQMIRDRHAGASDLSTAAWRLHQLAEQKIGEAGELYLGTVSASISSGTFAMVDVVIRSDGYLELRPGMGMG